VLTLREKYDKILSKEKFENRKAGEGEKRE
jgi:hypothetical protein